MKIYVDGLILKEKLKHLLDEWKNFKRDLSLKELSDFLEKYQIDKPVEDRYDRSRKFIDWNNDKEGWPHEYLALVLIDDLDDFTYVFDMPPVTEVHREPTVEELKNEMVTKIAKNILEANSPKNIQLYEVDTKDIHYEPDYMLADETVGPEEDQPVKLEDVQKQIAKWNICNRCVHKGDLVNCVECEYGSRFEVVSDTEVECLNCVHENNWDQCTECRDYSDFKMKSCETCKNFLEECAWCMGYSKYEYNHELEELEDDEEEEKVIELTLNDIASILLGETVNGVKLKL